MSAWLDILHVVQEHCENYGRPHLLQIGSVSLNRIIEEIGAPKYPSKIKGTYFMGYPAQIVDGDTIRAITWDALDGNYLPEGIS